ncbi:MAG: integrin alpha, partial [Cyanobacteria bacterium P01_A01_bin.83]
MDHSLNIEKTKENISNQKTADNVINLSELKPTQGFAIKGIQDADSGIYGSVSEAGDVNGDGYQDIIIGAPDTAVNNKLRAGHVYVIFGHENQTSSASLDVNNLDGSDGFVIEGLSKGYRLGESVSNAGDVNHDGIDDLLLGIPYAENNNQERSGKTYLLFGDSALGSSGTIDLSTLNNNSVVFQGGKKGSYLGISVSAAGDFNADGIDD